MPTPLESCQGWDTTSRGGNYSTAKYCSDAWHRARHPLLGRAPLQTGLSRTATAPGRGSALAGSPTLPRQLWAAGRLSAHCLCCPQHGGRARCNLDQPAPCLPASCLCLTHPACPALPVLPHCLLTLPCSPCPACGTAYTDSDARP